MTQLCAEPVQTYVCFIYPDVCWEPFSKLKRIFGFISIKYWKGVINDKFWNIDLIHLCWLLAELDKQMSSVQGGDYCRRTFSPGFVKNSDWSLSLGLTGGPQRLKHLLLIVVHLPVTSEAAGSHHFAHKSTFLSTAVLQKC